MALATTVATGSLVPHGPASPLSLSRRPNLNFSTQVFSTVAQFSDHKNNLEKQKGIKEIMKKKNYNKKMRCHSG